MKRRMLSLLIAALITLAAFAACGPAAPGTDGAPADPGAPQLDEQDVLDTLEGIGNAEDDEAAGRTPVIFYHWTPVPEMQVMVEEYNKSQDRDYLIYRPIPDGSNAMIQMNTMLLAGEEMDITSGQSSVDLVMRYENDLYEPLNSYFDSRGLSFREMFGEVAESLCTGSDGNLYCMPYAIKNFGMFYNKTIFDNAGVPYPENGWTWDDLTETALAVSSGEGADRIYGLCWEPERWTAMAVQELGLNSVYKEGGAESNFDHPAWLEAMQYTLNLQDIGALKPLEEYASLTLTETANRNSYFWDGMFAIYIGSTFEYSNWGMLPENAHDFECGVVTLPVKNEGDPYQTIFQFSDIALASVSQHKEEAFDFMYWYSSQRPDITCGEKHMQSPAPYPDDPEIARIADEKIYGCDGFDMEEAKWAYTSPEIAQRPDYTFSTYPTALPEIRDIMITEHQLVFSGDKTPEQAMTDIKSQADAAIQNAA